MRRRLPVIFGLVCLACYAVDAMNAKDASAGGSHSGGSAPAPAPAPAPSGGSAHGGGSHGGGSSGGGSARGGGSSRGGGTSNGGGRSSGGGSGHGSTPAYGSGGRGGGAGNGGGVSRVHGSTAPGYVYRPPSQQAGFTAGAKAGTVDKVHEYRWVCRGPGGSYYYSWAGPCEDYEDAPAAAQQVMGIPKGQATGYENGTDYATDPFSVGVGPGAGTPRATDMPILTRSSDTMAPYAVILRDGMAFASVERPRQSGKMIVARDRSGNLFSIRASEVDMAATKPATPAH
jgi:hypothetical protein